MILTKLTEEDGEEWGTLTKPKCRNAFALSSGSTWIKIEHLRILP
jgi:hypothetical protein